MRTLGILITLALCLVAQPRDSYRDAYKQWREGDPNLERDAATAGAQLGPRAQKMSAEAVQYEASRKAFLGQMAEENARKFAWLESPALEPPVTVSKSALEFVASEMKAVQRNTDTFAGDPDPGIQQLRVMLLKENSALSALNASIADREKAAGAATASTRALEESRMRALDEYHDVAAGWNDAAPQIDRESAAWVEYYKLLSTGAQGNDAPATPATTVAAATETPSPSPSVSKPPVTPLPLVRYTGAWTFPVSNGLYHGTQPEFADLVVHEENGHAIGTLFGRFKLAAGITDPVLRFDFSGDFNNTRNQLFRLETSDGAKGTLELIPGPAFNLIEVNFQIDAKPGKVRMGNMVLVKK